MRSWSGRESALNKLSERAFRGPFAFPHLRRVSGVYFHRRIFLIAVVVYLITAWNSTGFHSADEHFQVIAFAQWKLGDLPVEHLPWEFAAEIRSSFQPWIAVATFKVAALLGIHDPFMQAFLLRACTALLALFAIRRFVNVVMVQYPQAEQRTFILLSYSLWFIPFVSVRFSSEGWSAIFLLRTIAALISPGNKTRNGAVAGTFAGIALLCRPPVALIVLALLAWSRLVRRDPPKLMLSMFAAAGGVLLIGVLLDTAFYGHAVWTTWNYIALGMVGDPAHRFDELPWYYYPPWIVKYAIPPIGATILLAMVLLLWKRPSHLIVWCAVPYVVIHSYIAHKELRFLYPLAFLVPWLLVEAWSITGSIMPSGRPIGIAIVVLVLTNMIGLWMVMSSPAGEGRVRLAETLHREARPGERIGYLVDPALLWRIELPAFYAPPTMEQVVMDPALGLDATEGLGYLVVQDGTELRSTDTGIKLEPIARTTTRTEEALLYWHTWGEGQRPWTLYRVEHSER